MTVATTSPEAPQAAPIAFENNDLAVLFASRANMYGLLAGIFRKELDYDQICELKHMQFPTNTGNASMDQGFKDLFEYLRNAWQGSTTELAIDYSRTFIGNGTSGYSAAYLYESVYTSERRLLAREARGEVLQYYRHNNLKKGVWNDLEDHLALELEFMQRMSLRTAEALVNDEEEEALNSLRCQYDFVRNHLNNWLPMMAGDVLKFSETKFYQGAARVVLGYCEEDERLLAELLQDAPEAPVSATVELA